MNIIQKIENNRRISAAQSQQQLVNCALLVAYVYGQPSGWLAICEGHVDGFRSDYAMVHHSAGNFTLHKVSGFYLIGGECDDADARKELDDIRAAVAEENEYDELPTVTKLTPEEITAAVEALKEAWSEQDDADDDAEEWLRELCDDVCSDLAFCDWTKAARHFAK